MMKTLGFTLLGALLGSALIFGLVYFSGWLLLQMHLQLYDSESNQQRNFNIVMVLWLIFTVAGGWIGYKMRRKI